MKSWSESWRLMVTFQEPEDERTKYVREHDKARRKRADRLFHWSLGMPPEDDMDVQANRVGITWRELMVAGAVGLAALGIWRATSQPSPDPAPPPAAVSPLDSEYEIRFYDADGNPIQVDRWPGGQADEQ